MTNQEVVLNVYNNINIKGICIKLGVYQNIDDIESMVYEIILKYDTDKLNNIIKNGALLSFVYICVRNISSSSSKNEWNMLKSHHNDVNDNIQVYDNTDNDMVEWLEKYFLDILQKQDKKDDIDKLILYYKYIKKWTLTETAKNLQLSRNMVNNYIQQAKSSIKKDFNELHIS